MFDVGDTLVRMTGYDRRAGVAALLARGSGEADLEEVVRFGEELDGELESRCSPAHLEYSQRAFHRLLYGRFGVTFDLGEEELEWLYWKAALAFELEPGAPEALAAVRQAGCRSAVISNTTFSAEVIRRELCEQGVGSHFEIVLSSADLGIRKPDERIFQVASGLLEVEPSNCWYVGNSPFFDVRGASRAGMRPVWYNRAGAIAETPADTIELHRWADFQGYLTDG